MIIHYHVHIQRQHVGSFTLAFPSHNKSWQKCTFVFLTIELKFPGSPKWEKLHTLATFIGDQMLQNISPY